MLVFSWMLQLRIPAAERRADELRSRAEPAPVASLPVLCSGLLVKGNCSVHYLGRVPGKINGSTPCPSHGPLMFPAVNESLSILSEQVIPFSLTEMS